MLILKSSRKIFRSYKCDYPSRTVNRIKTGLCRVGIKPVYLGREIKADGFTGHVGTIWPYKNSSSNFSGKGTTRLLAKASAYAELMERYSAQVQEQSAAVLDNGRLEALPASSLLAGKVRVTRGLLSGLKRQGFLDRYIEGFELPSGERIFLPIKLIVRISGSNGLAAGNTIEEATAQALCEVVERHVVSEIYRRKLAVPTIRQSTIKDEAIGYYIRMFNKMGKKVIIKDLSLGRGYPVVGVVFLNERFKKEKNPLLKREYRRFRAACSANAGEAAIRCFLEELQKHETHTERFILADSFWRNWAESDELVLRLKPDGDSMMFMPRNYTFFGDSSFLEDDGGRVSYRDVPSYPSCDSCEDVKSMVNLLRIQGHRSFMIDLTHPVARFPVVRVVIPGISDLIPFFNRKWLKKDGVRRYFLGYDTNLFEFHRDSSWTRSRKGIKRLVDILERRFVRYGIEDRVSCGKENLWLFYLSYELNVYLGNVRKALKYIKTIRDVWGSRSEVDILTSKHMFDYLSFASEGCDRDGCLELLKNKYGHKWARKVRDCLDRYDLCKVKLKNPFLE